MSIHLPSGSFKDFLKSRAPMKILVKGKGQFQASPIIVAPMNADIRFSMSLPQYNPALHKYKAVKLPETWDWRNVYADDSDVIKQKKKKITQPLNQLACGSCWTFSTASSISDNFVVATGENPDISPAYALACHEKNEAGCGGGMPAQLANDISRNGIGSNSCIDYKNWCNPEKCDVCAEGGKDSNLVDEQNACIPKCPQNCDKLYYIKEPSTVVSTDGNDMTENVKSHIYTYGPIVGGYIVLSNFVGHDIDSTYAKSGGVYLENVDYGASSKDYFLKEDPTILGCHAVSVVGWGVVKGVKVKIDGAEKTSDVPYWYVRNSWSPKWGDGGFFKIAMYPFNKISQFDRNADYTDKNGQRAQIGGFIVFKPDPERSASPSPGPGSLPMRGNMWLVIGIVASVLVLFLLLFLYWKSKSEQSKMISPHSSLY